MLAVLTVGTVVLVVVVAAAGFVGGVLFGRRNTQKVETVVTDANKVISKL